MVHQSECVMVCLGDGVPSQVFEDMPQEMRSRFWYVLAERPDLAEQLLVGIGGCSTVCSGCSVAAWHPSGDASPAARAAAVPGGVSIDLQSCHSCTQLYSHAMITCHVVFSSVLVPPAEEKPQHSQCSSCCAGIRARQQQPAQRQPPAAAAERWHRWRHGCTLAVGASSDDSSTSRGTAQQSGCITRAC